MIDKATVQRIKDAANIVDVVSDYVHLTKRGANFVGLCPFHNERTPSFSVNPARNFCHCFSCHKGGSPVNFIMEKEGISYYEALKHLAAKYGIKVEERELTDEERRQQTEREGMFVANEWAMGLMESALRDLPEGEAVGLSYVYGRGLTDEAIKAFRIGYSPDDGQWLISQARKHGYDIATLKAVGLVGTSQQGREYDRFRGRVIFPVLNSAGKPVAFGGRDLKGGPAKYINSPESEIYKKNQELYGIYQAKNEIVRVNKCYLVEGYLDVIGMWQAGLKNTVASSGTALTDGQIALIHRFTDNVTLIYDGDAAGIKASLRGIDMLLAHKMHVQVLLLPDGDDPDSFSRKRTAEEMREYIASHETDIIRFKAGVLMDESGNDPQKRSAAIHSIVDSLANVTDDVQRSIYIQECSDILNVDESVIARATDNKRLELREQWRKQRDIAQIDRETSTDIQNSPATSPDQTQTPQHPAVIVTRQAEFVNNTGRGKDDFGRSEIESRIMKLCVRYAFRPFCFVDDDESADSTLDVIRYVSHEFAEDELEFVNPTYQRAFNLILSMYDQLKEAEKAHAATIDKMVEKERRERLEPIIAAGGDISAIEAAENAMMESLEQRREELMTEFRSSFAGDVLASHEDDDIRTMTVGMLAEPYKLSKYHTRNVHVPTEAERLSDILPKLIYDLKDSILARRLAETRDKMALLQEGGDLDQVYELMKEMQWLMELRREIALSVGERTLDNRLSYSGRKKR